MKVLIYTEYFFPISGGVQTIVLDLARGLTKSSGVRFEVTIVTRTRERSPEEATWSFRVIRWPSLWGLIRLIRDSDIIHLAGPAFLPMLLAIIFRKRLIIEHHGFHPACPNGLLFLEPAQSPCPGHYMAGRYAECFRCNQVVVGSIKSASWLLTTPVRRYLSNRADVNVMPTKWLGDILRLKRSRTIYHGVASCGESQAEINGGKFAFQGRMVSTKGAELLIQAVELLRKENRKVDVVMVGDGPELPALRARAATLNGQMKFVGHVADVELESVLSNAAAVVMPSVGGEVFGLVAAENMMRGKPMIVSDIGALQEVVGDTGLVFPAKDSQALAQRMAEAMDQVEHMRRLGAAARKRAVQIFDRDNMIAAHVSMYREVVHS